MKKYRPINIKTLIFNILVVLCISSSICHASDLIYIGATESLSIEKQQIKLVGRLYGLNVKHLVLNERKSFSILIDSFRDNLIGGIIISAKALQYIDISNLTAELRRGESYIPLLIMGLTPKTDKSILEKWTGGTLTEITQIKNAPSWGYYKVAKHKDIALELSGLNFPFLNEYSLKYFGLILNSNKISRVIVEIADKKGNRSFPIFSSTNLDGADIFFQTGVEMSSVSNEEVRWHYSQENFMMIAPLLMFVKYAFADKGWHSVGDYANLTIDDPWLTEPYGILSYMKLFSEMEKANFHTTIAFVPWNYDRNKPDVLSLFLKHPERFSISIHGNNHDHMEFDESKSFNRQEKNIQQSLARMEIMANSTGIPYDKVMIFPHEIAPAKTLALLKKYNFFATINFSKVPLGAEASKDPVFNMRPVTLDYENFPSIKRFRALKNITDKYKAMIAINLFLDNPILLYSHHNYLFGNGINTFNKTAQIINRIQPETKWNSLGYITQHLYLEKLRDDGNYDILSFSRDIVLKNEHQRPITFYFRKEESFKQPIKKVMAGSQPHDYYKCDNNLCLNITIDSGESKNIVIEYENNLELENIDISSKNFRIFLLRKFADFRDIILSKSVIGRNFTHYYYERGFDKAGLIIIAILFFLLSAIFVASCIYLIRKYRKKVGSS